MEGTPIVVGENGLKLPTDASPAGDRWGEPATRLFRRQFLIGPEPVRVRADWVNRQLGPRAWISHCPQLRVAWGHDGDGRGWGIVGVAVQTSPGAPDPIEQIGATSTGAIPEATHGWAGRWVLVDAERVYPDAAATLGCYVRIVDARAWISSSAGLLSEVPEPLTGPRDPRRLQPEGMTWYPLPGSRLPGIRRLLPSQALRIDDGAVEPRKLMPPLEPDRDPEEILDLLQRRLASSMRHLPRDRPLWLSLTAGRDTRLLLSLAHQVNLPAVTYTQETRNARVADRLLPPRLAALAGYDHLRVRRRPVTSMSEAIIERHTGGHDPVRPRGHLLDGLWEFGHGLAIRGNSCAVGKGVFVRRVPTTYDTVEQGVKALLAAYGEPASSSAAHGLREWLEWVAVTPHESLDWRDRFHIEQLDAGWLAAIEQQTDVTPFECVQPANAAAVYALVLSLPEDLRRRGGHHEELIRRLSPDLRSYPCNPSGRHFGRVRAVSLVLRTNPRRRLGRRRRRLPGGGH